MVFCGLRLRKPTDPSSVRFSKSIDYNMDMPGTHYRNLVAPQTIVRRKQAQTATAAATSTTAPAAPPPIYLFENNFEISSRFDGFSQSWSLLTILLIISSVIFMIAVSTASNDIYGVSPTDRFAPPPKKFKNRVLCFSVLMSLILSLLCGIIIAHMITTEQPPSWLKYVMIISVFVGLAGVIATAATPQTDDSNIRVFYTHRGLAKVSGSSGWVIRCMFLSLSLFIFCTPIIYWITSYVFLDKNRFISNMDQPGSVLKNATPDFYDRNAIYNPSKPTQYVATLPFYGAGPVNISTNLAEGKIAHPSVHQMRFGLLTIVTPQFVDESKTNIIETDTTVEQPLNQSNAGAIIMDVLIPVLCSCTLFYLFKIYNIMAALALIVNKIDDKQKKDAFNRSHKGVVVFLGAIVLFLGLIIAMWLYSFLCWLRWEIQKNQFQKRNLTPAVQVAAPGPVGQVAAPGPGSVDSPTE